MSRDRYELILQYSPWDRRDMRQLWLDKHEKTSDTLNFKIYALRYKSFLCTE